MYSANLRQIHRVNPGGKAYDCWVVLVCLGARNQAELTVRELHQQIEEKLANQNVHYAEVTTQAGQDTVYAKFGSTTGKHPLFMIFNQYPLDYRKDDPLVVVEWGRWTDMNELRDNVVALAGFFSNAAFRKSIITLKTPTAWENIGKFLEKHGLKILGVATSIATALL